MTANYTVGPYSVQLQQRHIASVGLNRLWVEGVHVDDNTIASGNFTNARLGYTGEMNNGGSWTLALDVTNLFDSGPPRIAGANQGTPFDYEIYGRRYLLSLRGSF